MSKRLKQFELAQRRRRVSELRLQGWTLREIGRELGIDFSQVSRDCKWCREQWRKDAIQDTGERLLEQMAQNDLLIREGWAAWERSKLDKTTREVETQDSPEAPEAKPGPGRPSREKKRLRTEGQTGNPAYLALVERGIERQNKILGIDGSQASIMETLRGAADLVKMMDQTVIAPPAATERHPESGHQGNGNGKP